MAGTIQGIRSLPLADLIGATLVAIVQADTEAARATLDFIETVGFVPPAQQQTTEGGIAAGNLRMAEFRYKKLDENNEVAEFVATVPVLALVPIPALQVKDARFKLAAQITDISQEKPSAPPAPAPATPTALAATNVAAVSRLQPLRYQLLAKPAAASGAKEQEVRSTFHIELEVTMGQADLPLGMEKLFNLMDQAIQDRKPTET